ncbi:MAG: AMP-binding protein [Myxococcales bacterium]|nr:AMP-binding protein [Myxococcales bacterium]
MELLFPWLAAPSERACVRLGERALTQRQLAAAIGGVVATLRARGAEPGARIGVWTKPALETLVCFAALAAAGYVIVPMDPKLGEAERAHVEVTAKPAVILGPEDVSLEGAGAWTPVPIRGETALLLFTSGTTGAPKAAAITDRNIAANLDMLADAWAWTGDDTVVHALPLFHVHGLVLGLFGALRRGGALRWVPRFSPADLAAAVAEEASRGSAIVFAVPTMYHRLCEAADQAAGLAAARLLVSGSAPLRADEHRTIERLFGQAPVERYGLTETLINCSTRGDGDRRAGSVGRPLRGVELRLVDDARVPLSTAEARDLGGEICVRGPHVFAGYLDRPDATSAVMDAEGWFYTGDVATISDDGFVTIIGRRSTDIIKCGGFKVGAGEIEACLCEHPAVAEAAVIGAPDPDLGERILAFVVTRSPVEPGVLVDHVAARLSPHKRPREVKILEALPRNAMGKIVKTALRGA